MSWWDWFRFYALGNIYVWWVALILISSLSYPVVRRFRLWQSKRRFMESQSARLANPQNADVRFQLANLYAEGGSWRRAERHALEAVRVAKENPLYEGGVPFHFLLLLGRALYHRARYGEAAQAYSDSLGVKSEFGWAEAELGLGKCFHRMGDFEKARTALEKAVQDNASTLEAYFRLAQVSAKLGRDADVERARSEFRRVAATLPRFAGRSRMRWRLAFFFFPLTRHLV